MREIVFHIGMAKCGSTTLQNNVFKFEKGALGTYKGLNKSNNYAKQFQSYVAVGGKQFNDFKGLKKWYHKIESYANHNGIEDSERLLLSSELLSQSNKLSYRPIIGILKKMKEYLDVNVKVLVVIRNQSNLLASKYVQSSYVYYNASQKNFEKWLQTSLHNKQTYENLMWLNWYDDLRYTFGSDNVCMLPLEEMTDINFWNNLVDFASIKSNTPDRLLKITIDKIENVRRESENSWFIRPFDIKHKASQDINHVLNLIWKKHLFSNVREDIIDYFIEKRLQYLEKKGFVDKKQIESKIYITEKASKIIMNKFATSNKRLSKMLAKDMSKYNYHD